MMTVLASKIFIVRGQFEIHVYDLCFSNSEETIFCFDLLSYLERKLLTNMITYEYIDFNLSDDHDVTIDVISNDVMLSLDYNDCSIDDKIGFIPIDSRFNMLSILDHIGGFIDELFTMNILPYLTLADTIHLSMTCKTFHRLSQSNYVWNILYRHDFISDQRVLQITASERMITHEVQNKQSTVYTMDMYRQRYIEIHDRFNRFEEGLEESRMMLHRFRKQHSIEIILEYTQIRVMLPLLFAVTFITAILLSIKLQGSDIPYWSCFLPIILYLTYIMISMIFTIYLHGKQFDLASIFFGMWINFKSPLSYIYEEFLLNDMKKGYCLVVAIFLVMIQVILAAIKLSCNKYIPKDFIYAEELIPTWLLILGYLLLPVLFGTSRTWLNGLLIVLLPCMIFFINISLNLNGSDLRMNHRNISLSIIFIPLWIVEIFVLFMSFLFLRSGVIR